MALLETPGFGDPESSSFQQDLDHANHLGGRLAKVTGRLVVRFWPDGLDQAAVKAHFGSAPKARARRRSAVMSVYDPQLVELAGTAYRTDMSVLYLTKQIAKMHFDRWRRELWVYIPPSSGLEPLLPFLGWDYNAIEFCWSNLGSGPASPATVAH